jgi:hypothetical protein
MGKVVWRVFEDVIRLYFFVFLNTIPETLHDWRILSDERKNANARCHIWDMFGLGGRFDTDFLHTIPETLSDY